MRNDDANVAPRKEAHVLERRRARDEERDVRVEVLVVEDFVDAHVDGVFEDRGSDYLSAASERSFGTQGNMFKEDGGQSRLTKQKAERKERSCKRRTFSD